MLQLLCMLKHLFYNLLFNSRFYFHVIGTPDIKVITGVRRGGKSKRQVSPLLQIKDAYPQMVIAHTGHDGYQYEGIQILDIADWLLDIFQK